MSEGSSLAPARFLSYLYRMLMSIEVTPKKRGRPATGKDPATSIRLSPELRAEIDAWCEQQPDRPKRSEAIRRLVEEALKAKRS
ncbi:ribbon-helix-helix domain-containing protein [Methylobacterium sp. UNC378MF]|uniref:ribbon-helix-helix domain-containing protein n=1 Tax=Methylobacterium sp. UNC378MF TaxID=1502748 RepID=UPI001FCD027E|nr:ribbon-helix-helix domain-containing protein [Methylobacterium sp. UNC378MF]